MFKIKLSNFYKPLDKHIESQDKKFKNKATYVVRMLNEDFNCISIDDLDELIFIAEATKADKSQSLFTPFVAIMSLILSTIAIMSTPILTNFPKLEPIIFIYIFLIVLATFLCFKFEYKRKIEYRAITYYLEKLKDAREKRSINVKKDYF